MTVLIDVMLGHISEARNELFPAADAGGHWRSCVLAYAQSLLNTFPRDIDA